MKGPRGQGSHYSHHLAEDHGATKTGPMRAFEVRTLCGEQHIPPSLDRGMTHAADQPVSLVLSLSRGGFGRYGVGVGSMQGVRLALYGHLPHIPQRLGVGGRVSSILTCPVSYLAVIAFIASPLLPFIGVYPTYRTTWRRDSITLKVRFS